MQKIQASFRGFSGKACTVYAAYDSKSNFLVISKETEFRADRFNDCVIISNVDLPDREVLFENDQMNDAIQSYFELSNSNLLEVSDAASRCNPSNTIERDGINEQGKSIYRISDQITNGQIAALAIAFYVTQAKVIDSMLSFQDQLADLTGAEVITI